MTTIQDINKFIDSGVCIAHDHDNGEIIAMFSSKFRFKIGEITKILYGKDADYSTSLGHLED